MFLNARRIDQGRELDFDVCIVGAGPAGITMARELDGSALRVCVLESGGLEPELKTLSLNVGENVGHPYPVGGSRLRYFGGTSNHWAGWCRPLDAIDFEERDGIPYSGWPLKRADLDPYYVTARKICQLSEPSYEVGDWARLTGTTPLRSTPQVDNVVFQVSPPTRFGRVYRDDLRRSRNVRVLLHANLVRLELDAGAGVVRRARVATLTGRRFRIRARRVVLAAGGIENARLLLASNDVQRAGVGNEHGLVGRFFSDHPHVILGSVLLPAERGRSAFYAVHPDRQHPRAEGLFTTTDRFVRSNRLLRCCLSLGRPDGDPPLRRQVEAIARDLDDSALTRLRTLQLRGEQLPNPNSRVLLSETVDQLGVPRVKLNWKFSDLDEISARRSVDAIAAAIGAAGLGRIYNRALVANDNVWRTAVGGSHQMGTARMHSDPRLGVVDANCRVHGVSNLYVGGSAVFPTTGFANPTLTIVALALRLAEHLKGSFR
jgi:choline dehydrogenase-like flavoprotein